MIEVLVSDLGQVALPFDFSPMKEFMRRRATPPLSPHVPVKGKTKTYLRRLPTPDAWTRLIELHDHLNFGIGGCPGREFYEHVVEELKLDATYEEFRDAWSNVFTEDHAVVDLIRRADARHRFLLSNTNEIHWEWILANHGEILRVFDRLIVSHEVGAAKPDPAIFRHVESLTGAPPTGHLLIDDMVANVRGARACGWDGILHTDAANLEFELQRRGLLPR